MTPRVVSAIAEVSVLIIRTVPVVIDAAATGNIPAYTPYIGFIPASCAYPMPSGMLYRPATRPPLLDDVVVLLDAHRAVEVLAHHDHAVERRSAGLDGLEVLPWRRPWRDSLP